MTYVFPIQLPNDALGPHAQAAMVLLALQPAK
jgi:hypothetical protein